MSCLFDSLAKHSDIGSKELRRRICKYLSGNPTISDIKVSTIMEWAGRNKESYIAEMKNPKTWGGALEIQAFCELTGTTVKVKYKDREIEFIPQMNTQGILTLLWTGNHYTAVGYE